MTRAAEARVAASLQTRPALLSAACAARPCSHRFRQPGRSGTQCSSGNLTAAAADKPPRDVFRQTERCGSGPAAIATPQLKKTAASPYHLTAQNVVGQRFARDALSGAKVALMGFCPRPSVLDRYTAVATGEQYFIHLSPDSVRILSCGDHQVVDLNHVYGGPVASATVEELAYYGVRYILAYGLAGGLGSSAWGAVGNYYIVKDAFAADGTTQHYTNEAIVGADSDLFQQVEQLWRDNHNTPLTAVRAATGDAIYREDDALLQTFRAQQCDVVNLDSAHLYAVSKTNGEGARISAVQCGVVSDVVSEGGAEADTSLGVMLSAEGQPSSSPMERVNAIAQFYLDCVVPHLLEGLEGR